jgi:hypothetical protein
VVILFIVLFVFIAAVLWANSNKKAKAKAMQAQLAAMSPEQRVALVAQEQEQRRIAAARIQDTRETYHYGPRNPQMLCPHCTARGYIRTMGVVQKKGVSGGKATAALMTGGLSLFATGLSRKEAATHAWCGNCQNSWLF